MTYFTSDQHFGHFNIIRLCNRPFASLAEMNATMLERWKAKVKATTERIKTTRRIRFGHERHG